MIIYENTDQSGDLRKLCVCRWENGDLEGQITHQYIHIFALR